jgi:hypothetical protein
MSILTIFVLGSYVAIYFLLGYGFYKLFLFLEDYPWFFGPEKDGFMKYLFIFLWPIIAMVYLALNLVCYGIFAAMLCIIILILAARCFKKICMPQNT